MPEEKKCATCLHFGHKGLDKNCSQDHFLIKNDFQEEGLNCQDWESRTEKTSCGN